MKGNKFLAAVLAASMAFSAVPVTALNVFAAVPTVTDSSTGADASSVFNANLSGVYAGIAGGASTGAMGDLLHAKDNTIAATDVTVTSVATVAASIKNSSGYYSVDLGSVTGTFKKDVDGDSTPETYGYTVDADKLKDASVGVGLMATLAKAYLEDKGVAVDAASITNALDDFEALSSTDAQFGSARAYLENKDNYATPGTIAAATYAVSYASSKFTVTVTLGGANAAFNMKADGILPADNTDINLTDNIDDSKDTAVLVQELTDAVAKQYKGLTVSDVIITKYKASTHTTPGDVKATATLTNKGGNHVNITINGNGKLFHGLSVVKKEAEKAVKTELNTIKDNPATALSLTSKESKKDITDKITAAVNTALSADSNYPSNEMLPTAKETTDLKKVKVTVDSYKAATATAEGNVKGSILLTYDYTDYMKDGSLVVSGKTTDIDPEFADMSAYQSTIDFDIDIDKLKEVDAKALKQVNASRTYKSGTEDVTKSLGTNISKISLIAPTKTEDI